jgi:hypothetical protein
MYRLATNDNTRAGRGKLVSHGFPSLEKLGIRSDTPDTSLPAEFRARRKPLLFVRLVGSFVLRFAARQFPASLFQLPPRFTRFEPLRIVHRSLL